MKVLEIIKLHEINQILMFCLYEKLKVWIIENENNEHKACYRETHFVRVGRQWEDEGNGKGRRVREAKGIMLLCATHKFFMKNAFTMYWKNILIKIK